MGVTVSGVELGLTDCSQNIFGHTIRGHDGAVPHSVFVKGS